MRRVNRHYVRQGEATAPAGLGPVPFRSASRRRLDPEAWAGRAVPFPIEADGRIVGQMHLFGIVRGPLLSGAAGYWVSQAFAVHGIATRALAMLCDDAFGPPGLHRIEVNVRLDTRRPSAVASPCGCATKVSASATCTLTAAGATTGPSLSPATTPRVAASSTAGPGPASPERRLVGGAEPRHTRHISDTPLWVRDPRADIAYCRFRAASSLIFLVIVAIWVAYLVQHWVRRREHLATARSVDKFSEAMRVLERRNPLPTTTLAEATLPRRRRGTAKDSRPEVVVKHASVSSPLRARRGENPLPPAHPVPLIELAPHRSAARWRCAVFAGSCSSPPSSPSR